MDIYRQQILDHYKHPHHFGHLKKFDASKTMANSSCGDRVTMEVVFEEKGKTKRISDIRFSGEGCAISIASASMLTDMVIGKTIPHVLKVTPDVFLSSIGTPLTPSRIKCALLPLETLEKTLTEMV